MSLETRTPLQNLFELGFAMALIPISRCPLPSTAPFLCCWYFVSVVCLGCGVFRARFLFTTCHFSVLLSSGRYRLLTDARSIVWKSDIFGELDDDDEFDEAEHCVSAV